MPLCSPKKTSLRRINSWISKRNIVLRYTDLNFLSGFEYDPTVDCAAMVAEFYHQ